MLEKAKQYFLFLVNLNGTPTKKAKDILDIWFEEHHNTIDLREFNKWYFDNYPEHNRAKDTYRGDRR
jgi:hypothetical protein